MGWRRERREEEEEEGEEEEEEGGRADMQSRSVRSACLPASLFMHSDRPP